MFLLLTEKVKTIKKFHIFQKITAAEEVTLDTKN